MHTSHCEESERSEDDEAISKKREIASSFASL
jgi:hypothetical protein